MKQFCCGDVVPGCKAVFRGEDESQILSAVAAHARADHGMENIPNEVVLRVRSLIREVAFA